MAEFDKDQNEMLSPNRAEILSKEEARNDTTPDAYIDIDFEQNEQSKKSAVNPNLLT